MTDKVWAELEARWKAATARPTWRSRLRDLVAASPLAFLVVHPPHGIEHLACMAAAVGAALLGLLVPRLWRQLPQSVCASKCDVCGEWLDDRGACMREYAHGGSHDADADESTPLCAWRGCYEEPDQGCEGFCHPHWEQDGRERAEEDAADLARG